MAALPGINNPTLPSLQQALTQWKALLDPLLGQSGAMTSQGFIGEVRSAMLTLSQFQSQAGTGWVLANGQSCIKSMYAQITGNKTVPDMRATVPRMKDNGKGLDPAGDLSLGAYEVDEFKSHTHTQTAHNHLLDSKMLIGQQSSSGANAGFQGAGNYSVVGTLGDTSPGNVYSGENTSSTTAVNQSTGSAETRAKSTIVNFFIRIN